MYVKITVKIFFVIFSVIFLLYLSIPSQPFPSNPEGVLQSNEPADTESADKLAYFANLQRNEVVSHYINIFENMFKTATFLTLRLNYPPEEAQILIRDQTRSSYLEEVVHPLRESIYINGFIPQEEKDNIFIAGKLWEQKITVKYIQSSLFVRLAVGILSILMLILIYKQYQTSIIDLHKIWIKNSFLKKYFNRKMIL